MMRSVLRAGLAAAALLTLVSATRTSHANPRALPFSYPYGTLGKGELEVEQYLDLTPTKALSTSTGAAAGLVRFLFQTEFEYGINDRFELGLYLQLSPNATDSFNGASTLDAGTAIKQRIRARLAEEGQWPLDVSLYLEVVEAEKEVELEGKVNLQRRIKNLTVLSNLIVEHEFYFDGKREWVLAPTLGASYQVTPLFHPGVESWMHMEFPVPSVARTFALGPHVFVGPTAMLNFGKIWWSNGFYFRVSDATRAVQAGDVFGRVYARSVIGLNL